jgi:hypothetical protein
MPRSLAARTAREPVDGLEKKRHKFECNVALVGTMSGNCFYLHTRKLPSLRANFGMLFELSVWSQASVSMQLPFGDFQMYADFKRSDLV